MKHSVTKRESTDLWARRQPGSIESDQVTNENTSPAFHYVLSFVT